MRHLIQLRQLSFTLDEVSQESQLSHVKAKAESVSNEDQITQKLYKDYSAFKREIFADILKNNPASDAGLTDGGRMPESNSGEMNGEEPAWYARQ